MRDHISSLKYRQVIWFFRGNHDSINHKSFLIHSLLYLTTIAADSLLQEALNPDGDVGEAEHLAEAHGAGLQQVRRLLREGPPGRALVGQGRQAVLAA